MLLHSVGYFAILLLDFRELCDQQDFFLTNRFLGTPNECSFLQGKILLLPSCILAAIQQDFLEMAKAQSGSFDLLIQVLKGRASPKSQHGRLAWHLMSKKEEKRQFD
jgi:hypothetical protein